MALQNKKSLGQHWLKDAATLASIADSAEISPDDTILEVGPGLGTLTSRLLARAGGVVAVEFDEELARKLPGQFPGKKLEVVHQDILKFDTTVLPAGYKVVANVPYYITSKIIRTLSESANPPSVMVLLVQKEVAERLASKAGGYSVLAISTQIDYQIELGAVVPAALFAPPPRVDSQVVILHRLAHSRVPSELRNDFLRLIKAGFSAKRKKLRSSLAGGLHMEKLQVEQLLEGTGVSGDARAEDLEIEQWLTILDRYDTIKR